MGTDRPSAYAADLAHVHHHQFGAVAHAAAATLLPALQRSHPAGGVVVDLGCGSGILARALTDAGYRVLGVDLSQAMLDIAVALAPEATFVRASFLDHDLPSCVAVVAVGEVVNYLFDDRDPLGRLAALFERVHAALVPGGLLLLDVAGPGRSGPDGVRTSVVDHGVGPRRAADPPGDAWFLCARTHEDVSDATLLREITVFRRTGELYRRSDEVHVLRLYAPEEVETELDRAGFRWRRLVAYEDLALGPGWTGFLAERAAARSD